MDDSSIAVRTEKLRREIELIRQEERRYHNSKSHSLAENAEHRSGSFESSRSVKSLERLSKKQNNNQATDQSGIELTSAAIHHNNCREQAIAQLCAFCSPKSGSVSAMGILRQECPHSLI